MRAGTSQSSEEILASIFGSEPHKLDVILLSFVFIFIFLTIIFSALKKIFKFEIRSHICETYFLPITMTKNNIKLLILCTDIEYTK